MDVGATNGWRLDDVVPAAEIVRTIGAEFPLEPVEPALPRRGRRALALPGRRRRDRRHRVGHAAVLRRLHARADLGRREDLHVPLRRRGHDVRALLRGGATDDELDRVDPLDLGDAHRPLLRAPHRGDRRAAQGRDVLHRRLTDPFAREVHGPTLGGEFGHPPPAAQRNAEALTGGKRVCEKFMAIAPQAPHLPWRSAR